MKAKQTPNEFHLTLEVINAIPYGIHGCHGSHGKHQFRKNYRAVNFEKKAQELEKPAAYRQ